MGNEIRLIRSSNNKNIEKLIMKKKLFLIANYSCLFMKLDICFQNLLTILFSIWYYIEVQT